MLHKTVPSICNWIRADPLAKVIYFKIKVKMQFLLSESWAHLPFHFLHSPHGVVWSCCLERIRPLRQSEKYLNDVEEQNSVYPSNKQDTSGTCWAPSSFVDSFCTSCGNILEQQSLLKEKCKDSRDNLWQERLRWQPYCQSIKTNNYMMVTDGQLCHLSISCFVGLV